jgi:protoheme IX farnesyltransferase
VDPDGSRTGRQVVASTLALLGVSVWTSVLGLTGALYLVGAVALGIVFLGFGLRLAGQRSGRSARRLFLASVVYLPMLLGLMVVDKV